MGITVCPGQLTGAALPHWKRAPTIPFSVCPPRRKRPGHPADWGIPGWHHSPLKLPPCQIWPQRLVGRTSPRQPWLGWGTGKVNGPQMRKGLGQVAAGLYVCTSFSQPPQLLLRWEGGSPPSVPGSEGPEPQGWDYAVLSSLAFQREPGVGQSSKPSGRAHQGPEAGEGRGRAWAAPHLQLLCPLTLLFRLQVLGSLRMAPSVLVTQTMAGGSGVCLPRSSRTLHH